MPRAKASFHTMYLYLAPALTSVLRALAVELLAHLREHVLMPKVPVQPGGRLETRNTEDRDTIGQHGI